MSSQRTLERGQNPFLFDLADAKGPVLRPKDAAALVLVRRKGDEVRVLMGERSARYAFPPGRFVFPGGRLDVADQRLAIETDLRPEVRAKVATGTTTSRARGLALAAVRETFEEAGVLVGKKGSADMRTRSATWLRFLLHGVSPRLEALDFVARARADSMRAFSWRMRRRSRPSWTSRTRAASC